MYIHQSQRSEYSTKYFILYLFNQHKGLKGFYIKPLSVQPRKYCLDKNCGKRTRQMCQPVFSHVTEWVTSVTCKREVGKCLLISNSDLTKCNNSCNSDLTFGGNVHLNISCIENRVRQNSQWDLPIESWDSERTHLHSKFLFQFMWGYIQT